MVFRYNFNFTFISFSNIISNQFVHKKLVKILISKIQVYNCIHSEVTNNYKVNVVLLIHKTYTITKNSIIYKFKLSFIFFK